MNERFVIEGGRPLEGTVEISGYKNAAGPILAATLLTNQKCIIDNLPQVEDVFNCLKVLKGIGVKINQLEKRKFEIEAGAEVDPSKMNPDLIGRTRMSVLLMGALLPRFKDFKISRPGGDKIGLRPITTHLNALEKLGAKIKEEGDFYHFNCANLKGREIVLKEFSVTATENLMLASVLAQGKTIIKGAAAEPQVQDLGGILKEMGAIIEGVGTHTVVIEGIEELQGVEHKVISDPLEAGTFIVASAITPGQVEIKNIIFEHLDLFLDKLEEMGVDFKKKSDSLLVRFSPKLKAVHVQALPYPGFPTDLVPIIVPALTQAEGRSLIHDPLYENRFNYVQELRKMGGDIEIVDPHRVFVFGKTPLFGRAIESWDIRAGASLIIAGLIARGKTVINNVYQIDRGYERIEEKLQNLGASIERIKS